jgi:hypothetical protein
VSGSKYKLHVAVIPEDDADRQLANGFGEHPAVSQRDLDIRPVAGGWSHVLDVFENEYIPYMKKYPVVPVVLLLDFDTQSENRRAACESRIPDNLKPRVFLLGTSDSPEELKKAMKMTFEQIGTALAEDCNREDLGHWTHPQLSHNLPELHRMTPIIRPILFPGS